MGAFGSWWVFGISNDRPDRHPVAGRNRVITVLVPLDQDDIAVKSRSGVLPFSCMDFRETMQRISTTTFRGGDYRNTASPSFRTEEASVLLPHASLRARVMQHHNSEADWDCQAKGGFPIRNFRREQYLHCVNYLSCEVVLLPNKSCGCLLKFSFNTEIVRSRYAMNPTTTSICTPLVFWISCFVFTVQISPGQY